MTNFARLSASLIALAFTCACQTTGREPMMAVATNGSGPKQCGPGIGNGRDNAVAMVTLDVGVTDPNTTPRTYGFKNAQTYKLADGVGDAILGNDGSINLEEVGRNGDVVVMLSISDETMMQGFVFWSGTEHPDPYQAVGIAEYSDPNVKPTVNFGSQYWPNEFSAPQPNANWRTVVFVDEDNDDCQYEYAVAIWTPGDGIGRTVVDPKITNGGRDK